MADKKKDVPKRQTRVTGAADPRALRRTQSNQEQGTLQRNTIRRSSSAPTLREWVFEGLRTTQEVARGVQETARAVQAACSIPGEVVREVVAGFVEGAVNALDWEKNPPKKKAKKEEQEKAKKEDQDKKGDGKKD